MLTILLYIYIYIYKICICTHLCGLGGSFRGFRFRCSRFSVATPLTVVHHFLPPLVSFCLPPPAKLESGGHYGRGIMEETGQGRIRCHGSLSGIIEIGRSHYYFSKGSSVFRTTSPATGPLLPRGHPPEEIRRAVFEVCRVCWEKTSTRMVARGLCG